MGGYRQILLAMGLCLLAVGALVVPQIPDVLRVYGEKKGRIVDRDSGEGIPNATVVAEGFIGYPSVMRWEVACTYTAMATTDENGFYRLPSEFSHRRFGAPFERRMHYFELRASKDGYVDAATKWPLHLDPNGYVTSSLKAWTSLEHPPSFNGLEVEVPTFYLLQAELPLPEKIAYFEQTGLTFYCAPYDPTFDPRRKLQSDFYQSVVTQICAGPPDETIGQTTLEILLHYAPRSQGFISEMQKVDRTWASHLGDPKSTYRFDQISATLKAGYAP